MSEKVAIFGTGYVGLVTGVCLARVGNDVICVDIDSEKIAMLSAGKSPIYEPQLENYLLEMLFSNRIKFTVDAKSAIEQSDIIMIAVGTPPMGDGSADLQYVLDVARTIGQYINGYKVIVTKSTVPPLTGDKIEHQIICERTYGHEFDVVSNPEFLKEGDAVNDFLKPDRIIIGSNSEQARSRMTSLYRPFMRRGHRVIFMDRVSAEITKYAANTMLASRISMMNELAKISESVGADIESVREGIGSDSRIGNAFLYPGPGYGGSCFPKDVEALARTAYNRGVEPRMLNAIRSVNSKQRTFFSNKIENFYDGNLHSKIFAVWGLSFKANTDDVRESPANAILEILLKLGARIVAYDPKANENFAKYTDPGKHRNMSYVNDQYEALNGANALIILTEWPRFRSPDLNKIKKDLKDKVVFDARNLLDPEEMGEIGISYISIGRSDVIV